MHHERRTPSLPLLAAALLIAFATTGCRNLKGALEFTHAAASLAHAIDHADDDDACCCDD